MKVLIPPSKDAFVAFAQYPITALRIAWFFNSMYKPKGLSSSRFLREVFTPLTSKVCERRFSCHLQDDAHIPLLQVVNETPSTAK